MLITESERDSLDKFMRTASPLAEFARSIRNDGSSTQTGAETGEEKPFDALAGIDVDNLPADVVERLKSVNTQVATLQTDKKKAEDLAKQKDELARQQQARADRNFETLRKHNLVDGQGKSTVAEPNQDNAKLEELTATFMREVPGLTPEIARTHAKLQLSAQKQMEPELFKKIGAGLTPALHTISDMAAGRFLAEAQLPKNDPNGIFAIPEVATSVNESVQLLVQQGQTITSETIANLKNMAYGKFVAEAKPEEREKIMNRQQTTVFSTGGTSFGSTGQVATLQKGKSNAPQAANADTAEGVAATIASMTRGMNLKTAPKGTK